MLIEKVGRYALPEEGLTTDITKESDGSYMAVVWQDALLARRLEQASGEKVLRFSLLNYGGTNIRMMAETPRRAIFYSVLCLREERKKLAELS